jgi:HAD superfamily hydrolase (TIGR01549 family)
MIQHICFDLDGTLINSFPTIYKCTLRTMQHLNITDNLEESDFYKMIGHHFLDIFKQLKINVADVETFIDIYKTYYFDYINDSLLYPYTDEVLKNLKEQGVTISLLTTKGQDQAVKLIEHFELSRYFSYISGRKSGMKIKPHAEPLLRICNELKVLPENTLMAGDSELDIRCGKNAGTKTCAVTYGYRTEEILKNEYPDFIVNNLQKLFKIVEGVNRDIPINTFNHLII